MKTGSCFEKLLLKHGVDTNVSLANSRQTKESLLIYNSPFSNFSFVNCKQKFQSSPTSDSLDGTYVNCDGAKAFNLH